MEISKLREIIGPEVAPQKHPGSIRSDNHAMVDDLNGTSPLARRTMLDLGVSK